MGKKLSKDLREKLVSELLSIVLDSKDEDQSMLLIEKKFLEYGVVTDREKNSIARKVELHCGIIFKIQNDMFSEFQNGLMEISAEKNRK